MVIASAADDKPMYHGVLCVALISLTAWPLMKAKELIPMLADPTVIFLFGSMTLISLYFLMTLLLPPIQKQESTPNAYFTARGPLYYWCAVSSWSCMIDLAFFLEVNGSISGFMDYYLVNGEAYFDTPYGALSLLWDAGPHFFMYLIMIYQIDSGRSCKLTALVWCGFMIVSVFTLLFGALCGKYSQELHLASFLNIPYAVLPLFFGLKALLFQDSVASESYNNTKSLNCLTGSLFLLVSALINWIRALGALGSSLPFAVMYAKYYEPYLLDDTKFGGSYVIFAIHIGTLFQVFINYSFTKTII